MLACLIKYSNFLLPSKYMSIQPYSHSTYLYQIILLKEFGHSADKCISLIILTIKKNHKNSTLKNGKMRKWQYLPDNFFFIVILQQPWLVMSRRGVRGISFRRPFASLSRDLASILRTCQSRRLKRSTSPLSASLIRDKRRSFFLKNGQ